MREYTREWGGKELESGEDDASETASRRLGACSPTVDLRDFPTTRDNLSHRHEWNRIAIHVYTLFSFPMT